MAGINIAYKKEAIYGLFKEFKIFIKFNKYGMYSTHTSLHSLLLDSLT